jgi:hypothetical protein
VTYGPLAAHVLYCILPAGKHAEEKQLKTQKCTTSTFHLLLFALLGF